MNILRTAITADVYEGIRALTIDKDNTPKWDPPALDQVDDEKINLVFQPFTEDLELRIPEQEDFRYSCVSCDFPLNFACASSTGGQLPKDEEPLRFKDGKKNTIQHYNHVHKLSFVKYRKIHGEDLDCFWCEKHLSGVCYGCFEKRCKFYLHIECSDKIPMTLAHPFHLSHTLSIMYNYGCCYACKRYAKLGYMCEMYSFHVGIDCAKLFPTLKLASHPHSHIGIDWVL